MKTYNKPFYFYRGKALFIPWVKKNLSGVVSQSTDKDGLYN